ncbi:MAG: PhzF family phenazine biosynthesis protein [Nitriliruptoraceae bacterium]
MASFHLVDAFTDVAFRGNPAGVVVLDGGPVDEPWAQRVADEVGASETAFVHPDDDGWRLRWWTPTTEVDLCGHATLATAHILAATGQADQEAPLAFRTRSGTLTTTRGADGRLWLDLPAWPVAEHPEPAALARLLAGVEGSYLGRTRVAQANDVVEVADVRTLVAWRPDPADVVALGAGGLIVTAPGEHADVAMRYLAPALGVDEDPATGSAACTVAPLWADRLGRATLTIEQRSARGGALACRVDGGRVHVGGHAVTTISGRLQV